MKIIFFHTLRSIKDNLGQLFVIVFTVTVLTALFFATLTLKDVFYNLQLSMANRLPGEAQISISGEVLSEYELKEALKTIDGVEYVDEYLEMTALLKSTNDNNEVDEKVIIVEATDLETLLERHSDQLYYYDGITEDSHYSHNGIWMTKDFADDNNIKVGDEVEIFIALYNEYQKFTVTYLFESEGIFANTTLNNVLTDFSSFGNRGLLTNAYVKISSDTDVDISIEQLNNFFAGKDVTVEQAIDYNHINEVVSGNEKLITVVMFFVLALVLFILFSSYLVIFQKRTNELSIFKAAGATAMQCILLLSFEGILYVLTGAFIGTILGRFAMQIVEITVIPNFTGAIRYHVYHYVLSMALGITVSLICSFFPALLLVKKSVKDTQDKPLLFNKKTIVILVVLFVLLGGCIACMIILQNLLIVFCLILIILISLLIYFGSPYLVMGISKLFSPGKGIVKLSSCTVKRNRTASRLSAIVGAVISFSFIAISIVTIVIDAIEPYYTHFRGDFVVQSLSSSDMEEVNELIINTYGVDRTVYLSSNDYKMIADGKEIEYTVYAINNVEDIDNVTTDITNKQKEKFFSEDNSIIISYDLANRLNKKIGDKMLINLENDDYQTYTIVGIDQTVTKNDRVCFIVNDGKIKYQNTMILVVSKKNISNMDLYKELSFKLQKKSCYIMFYKDWTQSTNVGISGIELLLRLLQVLIGGVAFIGVINMTISTQLERKRELNIYLSNGLDKRNYLLLSLLEGLVFSISGGIIGLLFNVIINLLMPDFAKLIDRYLNVNYFPISILIVVAVVMGIYTITYLIIAFQNRKKVGIERNII